VKGFMPVNKQERWDFEPDTRARLRAETEHFGVQARGPALQTCFKVDLLFMQEVNPLFQLEIIKGIRIDGLVKSPQSGRCERSEAISYFLSA